MIKTNQVEHSKRFLTLPPSIRSKDFSYSLVLACIHGFPGSNSKIIDYLRNFLNVKLAWCRVFIFLIFTSALNICMIMLVPNIYMYICICRQKHPATITKILYSYMTTLLIGVVSNSRRYLPLSRATSIKNHVWAE